MGQATEEQIIAEARIRRHATGLGLGANLGAKPLAHFIIQVVREGWTPPEPDPDPEVVAYQEWVGRTYPPFAPGHDDSFLREAFSAGAAHVRAAQGRGPGQ
jgi:hypothetical protein